MGKSIRNDPIFKKSGIKSRWSWMAGPLRDKNGVGLVKEDLNYLSYLIDWTHANSMEFHVTELNYWLNNENQIYISSKKTGYFI